MAVPPNLPSAVRRSIRAATTVTDADRALSALALRQAEVIQDAADSGDDDRLDRVVARVGPHLLTTLAELGLTPAARKSLGQAPRTGGKLAKLRAIEGGKSAAGQ